ncbi:MAG TPA: hypothetical protein VLV31_09765 [Candidatus Acidoferrales bacterium]|nr:hypothetical protein [Candidatus Acidoferrales bacterium]
MTAAIVAVFTIGERSTRELRFKQFLYGSDKVTLLTSALPAPI